MSRRKVETTPEAATPEVRVVPYVRVVPSGFVRNGQGDVSRLKATLLITPDVSSASGAKGRATLNLVTWPASVHRWLKEEASAWLKLAFAESYTDSLPTPCSPTRQQEIEVHFPKVASLSDRQVNGLNRLWQFTIFGKEATQDRWTRLAETIADSLGEGATRPGAIQDGKTVGSPDDKHFGEDGQLKSGRPENPGEPASSTKIDSVIQVPHADLALALEFQRAAELCMSLRQACGEPVDRREKQKGQVIDTHFKVEPTTELLRQAANVSDVEFATTLVARQVLRETGETDEHYIARLNVDSQPGQVVWDSKDESPPAERLARVLAYAEKAGAARHIARQKRENYKQLHTSAHLTAQRQRAADAYRRAKLAAVPTSTSCKTSPEELEWSGLKTAGAADETRRETMLNEALEAHALTTWPQYEKKKFDIPEGPDRKAVAAFFTLQSTPSLARAFLLALDIEIDIRSLESEHSYGFVSTQFRPRGEASLPAPPTRPIPWTLTKFRTRSGDWRFWPATTAELAQQKAGTSGAICANSVSQFDGVLMMSRGHSCEPGSNNSRYDVTSMDVRTVAELEMQRRLLRAAELDHDDAKDAPKPPKRQPFADLEYGGNRLTTGLTLLCRSAQDDAVTRLAMRQAKAKSAASGGCVLDDGNARHVVLDAEDLTIGFRLAVGILDKDWTTEWRPLTARQIQFGTSGDPDGKIVEDVLHKLVGAHTSAGRIALDSSFHTTPARLMPTADGVEAAVDQAVCVWDGGPMGVDCASPDDTTGYVRDSLPFGRTFSVPTAAATRLPRLRYGYPYRFAMMAVYSGGISLDLDELELQEHMDPAAGQRFYPPDSCREVSTHSRVEPYLRALRQSKLLAPEVLLPGGHATRQNGPMGYEAARLLVVRSTAADKDATTGRPDRRLEARATPALAQRIIIAPGMELSEAARHCDPAAGNRPVFDSIQSSTTPPGGLRQIEQCSGSARFPVVKTIARRGIDGRRHIDRRTVVTGQNQGTVGTDDEVSDGVFRKGSPGRNGYYPDPAADRIAVGLRHPGSKTYAFDPMILDIGTGRRFPDRMPVVVTLNRLSKQRLPGALKKDDVVRIRQTRFDPDNAGSITGAGPFACHEVIVTLAANEAFEIDVWGVPTADRLAREFALTQTLAHYLSLRGAGATPGEAISAGAMAELPPSLSDMLGKTLADLDAGRSGQSKDDPSRKSIRYIGPGATPVPDAAAIKAVAQAVAECLGKSPLPELVGLQKLMMVHACNRPGTEPQIAAEARDTHLERVTVRPEDIDCADRPAPIRAFRPPKGWRARTMSEDGTYERHPILVADAGSNELFLTGDVHLDLARIDTIEVVATTALPTSPLFDSSKRKRSVAMKRAGAWPTIPSRPDDAADMKVPGRDDRVYKSVEDIFGFRVFPDGRVRHRTSDVVLLRAENLALPAPGAEGLTKIALGDLFATLTDEQRDGPSAQDAAGLRVLRPHVFKDGKARIMEVRINGLARSLDLMRTVDRVAKPGDPWLSGTGPIYLVDELIPGEHLPARDQSNHSKPLQVILPATQRPAKCDARAPVPVFQWRCIDTATRKTRRRDSVVRIPLGREWFTSGQGERLGIVLWPPKLGIGDIVGLDDNKVPVRWADRDHAGRPVPMERIVDLGTFSDSDLGPGGSFITRRGADPIEDGLPQKRIFMSTRDFPDLARAPDDPLAATFVEDVDMPLADDGTEAETAEPSTANGAQPSATDEKPTRGGDKSTRPPLRVALVTYEPRFDVEREEWYVDVKLRDGETASPFVRFGLVRYQPHTHPALRCSRPVAQWVKPLPKRSVSISPTRDGEGIRVVMVGRAFTGRSWPSVVHPDDAAAAHRPSMRLSLFEDYSDDAGRSARRFHALTSKTGDDMVNARLLVSADVAFANQWVDGALIKPTKPKSAGTGDYALWEAVIPLKIGASGYKLHVEEVEHFLPASFAEEPVTEPFMREQGRFVQGGPRMAVTFDSLFDSLPVQPPK